MNTILSNFPRIKKVILGYECFKVKIRKSASADEEFNMGDTIYEMYVTSDVDLPVHALLNITEKIF